MAVEVVDASGKVQQTATEAKVTIMHAVGNLGFAGGNNVGLRLALGKNFDWFWLLNTDRVLREDTLAELLQHAVANPLCGITGSSLIYYYEPDRVQARWPIMVRALAVAYS